MSEAELVNSKVVIEPSASDALLALAYHEKLLTESENNDHCLRTLASRNYPNWLTVQALEQVVLFNQLYLTARLPWQGIQGNLLESGVFRPVEEPTKPEAEIQQIDPFILHGILKARGISRTPFEDPSIIEDVEELLRELDEWEEKYNEEPPSPISLFVERSLSGSPLEQKYLELQRIRQGLDKFQPIAKAVEEYLEVIATAEENRAFVMTPIFESPTTRLFQPRITRSESNMPTVLLRLTSAKLGVLPYGQSLGQTLELARDPATVALRVKIQEWLDSLTQESGSNTERIQNEISQALRMLNKYGVGSHISNITTYLAIPVGLVALISGFAAAIGWTCSVAGTIGLATAQLTTKKYRWASFGSRNKA